ncbi:MAG: UDP-N-acetylmuramoyl-L-alanyl-D-glutamate--2,6-diaminopimelate ligase [Phycisphaerales bacterium]|nr:UDP-N-acetylmuramoyl-L-alanyl-D-glutamate--2,6-diaminopimelate ligase [Phycisphaerales bacterium]
MEAGGHGPRDAGGERRLGELLRGLIPAEALAPLADLRITDVCDDSRRVIPGAIFFAMSGRSADGRAFVADAVKRGAAVIVTERPGGGAEAAAAGIATAAKNVPILTVPDARELLSHLALRWRGFGRSGSPPMLIGVTGTNGKSTTVMMVRSILTAAGKRCGLIGTIQNETGGTVQAAAMTTPGPLQLAELLAACERDGADAVAMEVSSHALDQRRTDGLRFLAAGFTNLTGDHLDYHGNMEAYASAKARLFERLDRTATAVVNADDPAAERMIRDSGAHVVRYGLGPTAEVRAEGLSDSIRGTRYELRADGRRLPLENPLIGRHNVYNALCAAGLALAAGVALEQIAAGLLSVTRVPGRLERVAPAGPADVFVDYAHTDDALRNVLSALRPLTTGRLMVVFGCGGNRDAGKRPRMGRVAEELADVIFVTSDNPRDESPDSIMDQILAGMTAAGRSRTRVDADRRAAIRAALEESRGGDVLLVAGKGHETSQEIAGRRMHFDDSEEIRLAAQSLSNVGVRA